MSFHGWPVEALEFFEGLEADNSKSYWQRNRNVYDEMVRGPMVWTAAIPAACIVGKRWP